MTRRQHELARRIRRARKDAVASHQPASFFFGRVSPLLGPAVAGHPRLPSLGYRSAPPSLAASPIAYRAPVILFARGHGSASRPPLERPRTPLDSPSQGSASAQNEPDRPALMLHSGSSPLSRRPCRGRSPFTPLQHKSGYPAHLAPHSALARARACGAKQSHPPPVPPQRGEAAPHPCGAEFGPSGASARPPVELICPSCHASYFSSRQHPPFYWRCPQCSAWWHHPIFCPPQNVP